MVVAAVALAALLRARSPGQRAAGSVLAAAPGSAWLVATVDVIAARPLLLPLMGDGRLAGIASATRAAGLGSLSDACGFEPLEHMRELMVALPEGGERGEFGAAFSCDLMKDALVACAQKVIRARGGHPSTSTRAGFSVIADNTDPRLAELAYRAGGPFVIGRGAWLDAMLDAAQGRGVGAPSEHAALRTSLSPRGSEPRALSVTAILPKSVRDRIRIEMDPAGGPSPGALGLLAIEEAGVAVTVAPGGATEIAVELRCETGDACGEIKSLVERETMALSADLGVRVMGLGPFIDALSLELQGKRLTVRSRAPTDDVARALEHSLSSAMPRRP
jgi:hypothetical protein